MQEITFLLTSIVSFSGIYMGYLLALIAPEELKPGEKYFKAIYVSLLAILIGLVVFELTSLDILYWSILPILIILYFVKYEYFFNYVIPILIYITFLKPNYLNIFGTIFLLGFPIGSMFCDKYEKNEKFTISKKRMFSKLFKKYAMFYPIILILSIFL